MKLSFNQIKEITTGAILINEEDGMISLKRFTKEQEDLYKVTNQDFYNKTFSTAGIKFLFKTDSKSLLLKLKTMISSSRKYFLVDISEDKCEVENLVKATIRSIDICGALGIPNIVVHAGCQKGISKEESFNLNKAFFEKLIPAMEKNNVNVLCENSTAKNMKDKYFTNTGKDMKEFVKYFNHPLFHACWDTGHGNCEGNQYDEIVAIGDDLFALHINDNSGRGDEHALPYFGTTNMDEIMNALIDINYNGYFTFESGTSLRPAKYWQGDRKTFEKDTRLSEPVLFMQKHLEKLMYEMGKYILKSYNCFEE